jgi:hypothetical protein
VDICNRLVRFDVDLVPEEVRPYIRDVYDHSIRINETVDTLRELLTSALEANLSLIAVAQNDSMKQLAAWAAIIAVPTMIAGVYGMNFRHMPELDWWLGYPFAHRPDGDGVRRALLALQARRLALMRIVIMGSGGTGGFFGAKLARAGEDVTFVARGEHLRAIQANGLRVKSALEGSSRSARPRWSGWTGCRRPTSCSSA